MDAALVKLALQSPSLAIGVTIIIGTGLWHVAATYTNFRYMRNNMVTKKDLQIQQYKLENKLDLKYVTRQECAAMLNAKKNGEVRDRKHEV